MKTATVPGGDPFKTLFFWDLRKRRLPAWILLACLLHALLFVAVEFEYASPLDVTPSRTPVWMPVEGTPEADRIFAWAESRDPTLLSPTRLSPRDTPLPAARLYQPSYDQATLPLVPYPVPEAVSPPGALTFAGIDLWKPAPIPRAQIPPPAATQIQFDGFPHFRKIQEAPIPDFEASPRDHLTPARFRLGVAPDGVPIFVFLLNRSGNTALDAAAARHLRQMRFEAGNELSWGDATYLWGADVRRIAK